MHKKRFVFDFIPFVFDFERLVEKILKVIFRYSKFEASISQKTHLSFIL